jgi:hypothetical protein
MKKKDDLNLFSKMEDDLNPFSKMEDDLRIGCGTTPGNLVHTYVNDILPKNK